ncbi:hypothetical protein EON71_00020 [bacterium]|nr:MAG: hypothetical protein EON71_00020 [bacterium]
MSGDEARINGNTEHEDKTETLIKDLAKFPGFFTSINLEMLGIDLKKTAENDPNSEAYITLGTIDKPGAHPKTALRIAGPPLMVLSSAMTGAGDYLKSPKVTKIVQSKFHVDLAHTVDDETAARFSGLPDLHEQHLEFLNKITDVALTLMFKNKTLRTKDKEQLMEKISSKKSAAAMSPEDLSNEVLIDFMYSARKIVKTDNKYSPYPSFDCKSRTCYNTKVKKMVNYPPKTTDEPDHIDKMDEDRLTYAPPKLYDNRGKIIPLGRNLKEYMTKGSYWIPYYEIDCFSIKSEGSTGAYGVRAKFISAYFWRAGDPNHIGNYIPEGIDMESGQNIFSDNHDIPMLEYNHNNDINNNTHNNNNNNNNNNKNNGTPLSSDDNRAEKINTSTQGAFEHLSTGRKNKPSQNAANLSSQANSITQNTKKKYSEVENKHTTNEPAAKKPRLDSNSASAKKDMVPAVTKHSSRSPSIMQKKDDKKTKKSRNSSDAHSRKTIDSDDNDSETDGMVSANLEYDEGSQKPEEDYLCTQNPGSQDDDNDDEQD